MNEQHWTDEEIDRREAMAHEVHIVYCMQYAINEGKDYWTNGDYSLLDEKIKNFDRALVAWHLTKVEDLTEKAANFEMDAMAQRKAKDGAYSERNKLIAVMSKIFPSSLERHPEDDKTWENDWRWIVFIDLPTGQASWHIHDSELPQFNHLTRNAGRKWDGHTNDQKYERLAQFTLATEPHN